MTRPRTPFSTATWQHEQRRAFCRKLATCCTRAA